MTNLIAAIPSPASNALYIGRFPIRGYSLMILLGIAAAATIGAMRYTTRTVVRDEIDDKSPDARYFWQRPGAEDLMDIVFWCVPFGIIGARLYHVLTSPTGYFNPFNLGAILRVWEGGLAIIGGIAGGALGAYIACRIKGIRFPVILDALAPGLLVAQAIGRWGNWFNQELFGGPTTLPWGLRIDQAHLPINPATGMQYPVGTLFHPTFLYESLWNLSMAGLLILIDRKFRLGHGRVFFLYVYLYSLGRVWIESIRTDPARMFGGIRLNAWSVMILGALALIAFAVSAYLHPNRERDARRSHIADGDQVETTEYRLADRLAN